MYSKKIIVALDSKNLNKTIKLVKILKNEVHAFKIGYQFFYNFGLEGYKKIYSICPKKYYNQKNVSILVKKYAHAAKKNKLDGIVCSPKEINYIRKEVGKNFIIITPGIRINNKIKGDDQKRVETPKKAIDLGANFLVIGRPITASKDPLKILKEINKSI